MKTLTKVTLVIALFCCAGVIFLLGCVATRNREMELTHQRVKADVIERSNRKQVISSLTGYDVVCGLNISVRRTDTRAVVCDIRVHNDSDVYTLLNFEKDKFFYEGSSDKGILQSASRVDISEQGIMKINAGECVELGASVPDDFLQWRYMRVRHERYLGDGLLAIAYSNWVDLRTLGE